MVQVRDLTELKVEDSWRAARGTSGTGEEISSRRLCGW
jgi:hypothetical protein